MDSTLIIPDGFPFAGHQLEEIISPKMLQSRVREIGHEISAKYQGEIPIIIGVPSVSNCSRDVFVAKQPTLFNSVFIFSSHSNMDLANGIQTSMVTDSSVFDFIIADIIAS